MDLLNTIIENLDLMYIVLCNSATYFIIRFIESAMNAKKTDGKKKSPKKLGTWWKRFISTLVATGLGFLMYYEFDHPAEPLFYGAFVQFVTWDYLFKPLVKMLPQFFSPAGALSPVGDDVDA